eukprot:TRINITY_DN855_c0_g1_i1.p1 TRINITY_DN855_c0_g1~~TRINITY_DN855_c0_g1_i1.p1  ORF type:complete len:215 (-),score=50.68 TRINITY_DN855_c0_g1_i1:369-989(-)
MDIDWIGDPKKQKKKSNVCQLFKKGQCRDSNCQFEHTQRKGKHNNVVKPRRKKHNTNQNEKKKGKKSKPGRKKEGRKKSVKQHGARNEMIMADEPAGGGSASTSRKRINKKSVQNISNLIKGVSKDTMPGITASQSDFNTTTSTTTTTSSNPFTSGTSTTTTTPKTLFTSSLLTKQWNGKLTTALIWAKRAHKKYLVLKQKRERIF